MSVMRSVHVLQSSGKNTVGEQQVLTSLKLFFSDTGAGDPQPTANVLVPVWVTLRTLPGTGSTRQV